MKSLESKSAALARIMAQEKLTVIFRDASTASFNPSTRVLALPNFVRTAPECVRYGFNAHEIAHALYTPPGHKITSLLNIVEDVRIERLIKRKYKGSASYMNEMYVYLWAENFFMCDEDSIKTKHFLDRLNVYAKTKDAFKLDIPFTEEEQKLVDMAFLTTTFEDVLTVCDKIKAFFAEKNEDISERKAPSLNLDDDEEETSDPVQESGLVEDEVSLENDNNENDNNEDEVSTENDDDNNDDEEVPTESMSKLGGAAPDDDEKTSDSDVDESDKESDLDDFVSETENALDSAFGDFSDTKNTYTRRTALIGRLGEDDIVKESASNYIDALIENGGYFRNCWESLPPDEEYKGFVLTTKSQVAYMVKQFDLKKRATMWSNTQSSMTGELDVTRLSEYKFADDLFLRDEIIPEGKNHGLVLAIDFSGSMDDMIEGICKQAAVLSMFARQASIPLRVFGFTSRNQHELQTDEELKFSFDDGDTPVWAKKSDEVVFEIINTTNIKKKEFDKAIYRLVNVNRWFDGVAGGTPLSTAALTLSGVVANWRAQQGLEIVNTVFLTDGASFGISMGQNRIDGVNYNRQGIGGYLDVVTKKTYETVGTEEAYDIYKIRTGSRLTVFYAGKMSDMRGVLHGLNNQNDIKSKLRKDGLVVVNIMPKVVDTYMLMLSKDRLKAANDITVEEGKAAKQSFLKKARAKASSKVFINHFMEQMA